MRRGMSSIEILILVLIVGLTGYLLLKESPKTNGIVFVDLERVFNDLGSGQIMGQMVDAEIAKLEAKQKELQLEVSQRLNLIRKSFGESPNETQLQTLAAVKKDGQAKLEKSSMEDRAAIANLRSKLMEDFRNSIKPYAKRIAEQQGAETVMIADRDNLLACPAESLITDKVLKAIREGKQNQSGSPAKE